ncbi:NADH-quinone oxidoreductase subunit J, partial [Streptococcus pyogenes]
MTAQTFLFYLFSAITVVSAVRVITARNPVHSALFLILTFATMACIWLLLQAEFL